MLSKKVLEQKIRRTGNMELNEMEKRLLYQTEGSEWYALLHGMAMASRYAKDPDRRKALLKS
jgi:hypothetical protein